MTAVSVERAVVYRGPRRRYFTKKAALRGYAISKYRAKHPCECEQPDYGSGYPGSVCTSCVEYGKVVSRYLRLLQRAGTPFLPEPDRFEALLKLAKEATNGWACFASRKAEHEEIARLHREIAQLEEPKEAEK